MIREDVGVAMLRVLKRCRAYKLPKPAFFEQVRTHLMESVALEDLVDTSQHIESLGWISHDLNSFRTERYWITDAGEMELAKRP